MNNPNTPITNALGPDWFNKMMSQIGGYCWKSKTGREQAMKGLEQTRYACETSYDHCMSWARTWSDPRGLEIIDQNAFWDEWKAWVNDRKNTLLWNVVRPMAFGNRYSQLFTPPETLKSLAASVIKELKQEGFGPQVFYGSLAPADQDRHQEILFLQMILRDLDWDVPLDRLQHGMENYTEYLRHINEVIRKKWEVAKCTS